MMRMEVMIPMAYVYDHRFSFLMFDLMTTATLLAGTVYYLQRVLPPHLPEKDRNRFHRARWMLMGLMGLDMSLMMLHVMMVIFLFPGRILRAHIRTPIGPMTGLQILIFVALNATRLFTGLLILVMLIRTTQSMRDQAHPPEIRIYVGWLLGLGVLVLMHLFCLFFLLIPSGSSTFSIYETFFKIRSLFVLRRDSQEQIQILLDTLYDRILPHQQSILDKQWSLTFDDAIEPPLLV